MYDVITITKFICSTIMQPPLFIFKRGDALVRPNNKQKQITSK